MTLNKVVLPAGESVYQDAKGQPMPHQRWPTELHYVDGGLEQADTTDFVCANRIIAEPWRQCFAVTPVNIGESEDLLSEEELDLVQGYMDQPFHNRGSQREGKGQDKPGGKWTPSSLVPMMGIPSCPARTSQSAGPTHLRRPLPRQDQIWPLGPPGETSRAEAMREYPASKLSGSSAR